MDTTGLVTFFTALLTAAVAIAGLLAAVALAASGLMYFGVVGHSQRAMEQAQNGVRASFIVPSERPTSTRGAAGSCADPRGCTGRPAWPRG